MHSKAKGEVFEATRASDGLAVVIKRYWADPSGDARMRAEREFDVLRRIEGPGVPRAVELCLSDEQPLLVLARIAGTPLESLAQQGPVPDARWLDLAIRLAETLERVHAARVMHRDITPANILVAPRTGEGAWILDFGSASEFGASGGGIGMTGTMQCALAYIAPEQTGRMNRGCDYRSDLYSLGATLYTALTGRPPFVSSDPLELIHAHIARIAPAASAVRPGVPEAFSRVLAKLLQKEPEDRYQNAGALRADLAAFRAQIADGGTDPDFVLARTDSNARPLFSRRLHGRRQELACMRAAYERCALGQVTCLEISGEPGCGKSALVHELCKTLAKSGGYLVSAKFDHYRDRAYGGWVNALDALAQQLLVESDLNLERWRRELTTGVGSIAQALVDLVPDLGIVLGPQPPIPVLGPAETQSRLALAVRRFVEVLATPAHPLVIFLDDVQWSDVGSLRLLEELLCQCADAALLVICAYRPNEVGAAHPFRALLRRLEPSDVRAEPLSLGPIGRADTAAMLAEALDCTPEHAAPLAEIVGRKTGHSPLLVRQLVDLAYENGWLRLQPDRGWVWDAASLENSRAAEGAVTLLRARMDLLQPGPRGVLEFASFVGDEFDVLQLVELSGTTRAELEGPLHALAADGLIVPSLRGFRFSHDRIREAAQLSVAEEDRAERHYRVGRLLLESIPESEHARRALDIVEHLNRGLSHLPEELRHTLVKLNHSAGSEILSRGAASTARDLLAVARDLFREGDWREHGAQGFELHLTSAEAEFQTQNFELALSLLEGLDRRPLSLLEFTRVAVKRTQILAVSTNPERCTRYALSVLRRMGVRWPLHPSRTRAWLAVKGVHVMMLGRSLDALRPAKFEPRRFCPILLLPVAGASFLRCDVGLTLLSVCLAMRREIRFGHIGVPGFLIANYAVFSYLLERDAGRARRAVEAALDWSARIPDPVYRTRTELVISAGLHPWLMPRREALAPLARISEEASEFGDPEFSHYARFLDLTGRALAGESVSGMLRDFESLRGDVRRAAHDYRELEAVYSAYRHLRRGCSESELDTELAASEEWLREHHNSAAAYVRTFWMLVLCVHGRYDLALEQSDALGDSLHRVVPFVHVADHTFYRGLACAALAETGSRREVRRLHRSLRDTLRRLQRWSKDGPDFRHMALLLQGERNRLRGDPKRARLLYEQSARRAKEQRYVHHAALAHERRAELLRSERRETEAAAALEEASALYADWGAPFKADRLLEWAAPRPPAESRTAAEVPRPVLRRR